MTKTFGTTPDFALYDISYTNAILYGRAMPQYGDKDEDNGFDETKDACNPSNFKDFTADFEVVRI